MFNIKIDNRECNEILLGVLKKEKDTTIHFCRLPAGDYQVDDYLLVERKTIKTYLLPLRMAVCFNRQENWRLCPCKV